MLLPLPLHHSYPLVIGLLTTLTVGATVVLPEGVGGPQIVRASRLAGATTLVGVPRLYDVLLAALESRVAAAGRLPKAVFDRGLGLALWSRRLGVDAGRFLFRTIRAQVGPRLRVMICGGAKLDADVNRKLEALGWTVFAGYGLAETASVFTTNARGRTRIGSAGKAVGDGEMRIAEPDENGIGEILLRGSNITSGYRNNPDATKAAFTPDGWFRTGDLGYIDGDGYLYVTGRAKEMIVLGGGKKVFPEPLEKIYAASPYIREIALLERAERSRRTWCGRMSTRSRRSALPCSKTRFVSGFRRWRSSCRPTSDCPGSSSWSRRCRARASASIAASCCRSCMSGRWLRGRKAARRRFRKRIERSSPSRRPLRYGRCCRSAVPTNRSPSTPIWPSISASIPSIGWRSRWSWMHSLGVQLTSEMVAGLRTVRDLVVAVTGLVERGAADGKTAKRWVLSAEEAAWLRPTGPVANIVAAARPGHRQAGVPLGLRLACRRDRTAANARAVRGGAQSQPVKWMPSPSRPHCRPGCSAAAIGPATTTVCFLRQPCACSPASSHVFPVDERVPMAAVAAASTILARGDILIWFPEGWVSPDGRLQRFRPGIGKLLTDVSAPVVPAYISGTFEAMPRGRRWPRRRPIRVVFGDPVTVDALEAAGTGESREERIADALRDKVAALARSIGAEP